MNKLLRYYAATRSLILDLIARKISLIIERKSTLFRHFRYPIVCQYPPGTIYLEPTNHCNLKCPMCPQHKYPRKKGFMVFSLFQKIVNDLPNNVFVQLFMGGESLMHPEIIPMIKYIKHCKPSARIRIATNGTLLNNDLSKNIVLSGLDYISFSFDGPDKETYEADNYEKTL